MFQTSRRAGNHLGFVWRWGLGLVELANNLSSGLAHDIMRYSSFFEHLFGFLSYAALVCNMLKRQDFVISSSFDLTLPPCLH
jgi:hypothetical protein